MYVRVRAWACMLLATLAKLFSFMYAAWNDTGCQTGFVCTILCTDIFFFFVWITWPKRGSHSIFAVQVVVHPPNAQMASGNVLNVGSWSFQPGLCTNLYLWYCTHVRPQASKQASKQYAHYSASATHSLTLSTRWVIGLPRMQGRSQVLHFLIYPYGLWPRCLLGFLKMLVGSCGGFSREINDPNPLLGFSRPPSLDGGQASSPPPLLLFWSRLEWFFSS